MKSMNCIFSQLCHSRISHAAAVMMVALSWSSLAFGGEVHDAAKAGDLERLKAILKDNPNSAFSKDGNGNTPLYWAAGEGHKAVAELLLANKAEVNVKDNYGQTPLHWAAAKGQKEMAELLLANKAEVDAKVKGVTPLVLAAAGGHKEVVKLLLANKADVNAKADNGSTALEVAAMGGHKDVVELLLASKAEVDAKDTANGLTSLHWAAGKGYKDVAELLLANKADVNAKANNGATPLHLAAKQGNKEVVELLLANKADVNAKANNGETPLHLAARAGHALVVAALLKGGATKGTSFAVAAIHGHVDLLKLLVPDEKTVDLMDNGGFIEYAELQKKYGADPAAGGLSYLGEEGFPIIVSYPVNNSQIKSSGNMSLGGVSGYFTMGDAAFVGDCKIEPDGLRFSGRYAVIYKRQLGHSPEPTPTKP